MTSRFFRQADAPPRRRSTKNASAAADIFSRSKFAFVAMILVHIDDIDQQF